MRHQAGWQDVLQRRDGLQQLVSYGEALCVVWVIPQQLLYLRQAGLVFLKRRSGIRWLLLRLHTLMV